VIRGPFLLVAAGCVAATATAFLVGYGRAAALASALVLATALAAAAALQLRPAPSRRPPPREREDELPLRLRQIAADLRKSEESGFEVEQSLRPLLVPIAAARLGRRGVDMALAPRRAQELLGDELWELVRPGRPPAADGAGGLAGEDLRTAIERLERL
jgi:hypothetical protein